MNVSPDQPLRALVVGAGSMGQFWLKTIQDYDQVTLAGLADINADAARQALDAVGAGPDVTVGTSVEAMIDEVAPDFVVDVTIPDAHYPVTMTALRRGLPVVGEKPLAATLAEAVELVAASEAYGQLFMVSQNRRYDPNLFAYREHVRSLGRLGIVVSTFFKAPRFGGFRDEMDHPLVLDMAIHTFDSARYLTGAEPVAVTCQEYNPAWSWYRGDAAATATFQMSDGTQYIYTGSWCSPGLETSWNGDWRISGEKGSACWDGDNQPALELTPGGDLAPEEAAVQPGASTSDVSTAVDTSLSASASAVAPSIAGALRDFVAALRTGSAPMGECHDNLLSLAMVHAALESARAGTSVTIEDLLARARTEALAHATGPVREVLAAAGH